MHEFGLVEGIIEAVQQRAGDRPVAVARVRIGTLHKASQGPMEQAFEMVGMGTIVEGATLELVQMPVTSTCRACGTTETGEEKAIVCQRCEASTMDYAGGDELLLESIEYRPTEPASAGSVPN